MQTKILSADELDLAVTLFQSGEIVAFPTETVYGLGAIIFDPSAIQKIFSVKGRPSDNPLIAHVSDFSQVSRIAIDIPDDFYRLARAFWPGPLTILLHRHPAVPHIATAGLDTIGVRAPNHPLARQLIQRLKTPIVAPSANLSGKPSSTNINHVIQDFNGKIPAVLDGGVCSLGIESTVLSLKDKPCILRPGSITRQQIEKVLKKPVISSLIYSEKPLCPGMKYRHYAPNAEIVLFSCLKELQRHLEQFSDENILVLGPKELEFYFSKDFSVCTSSNLYAHFREADDKGYDKIFIYCDMQMRADEALINRLQKASFR